MTAYLPIRSADSPLGQDAATTEAVGPSLAFDDARHLLAHRWLVEEAYVLDHQDYDAWLDLLAEDIHYYMPIRVTTALGTGYDTAKRMAHFDEDKYSLSRRVARFQTEHAWTEDPPSRIRHHLSNVRTFATDEDDELVVESAVLLFRSRGDVRGPSLVSAGRTDLLRRTGDSWLLARRHIAVDESVLRTQNLAIFL
ncbi:3-phenylpropionate/cinnamic acid dioxygenase subunit beta [Nocardioides sp. MAH-18]|uniref:3-phenylpropionate/cinnamic acid dioxygenase subunit beta n=1 Tax=Nocardioides agri TaxID=2682843 RepID=A0A6L6XNK3_9ACTN|nr:3-phenylpropionate/cinnamic acid dioxygenase subunit beta [Nocardioides sp. CGMCC 1.13656]MBA2953815.1 3-phenylpropionate/cinnamic acid dioxygenase subunit beta [Nocardioides sp. CGMCC 1.13656]MVQ48680.1 3-phenylpropionate/cinnamic acid dioxygenase subunit beta [Nocardioides sp. MAH-18]